MKNIVILLLLLSKSRLKYVSAQDSCFSLKGSTMCPAFNSFYIGLAGNQQTYPFLANVTDIQSFDTALSNYLTSTDFYSASVGCSDYNATKIPYARYSKTYMCATLIQDSVYSLPCNYQNNLSPPPLCQSTCLDYTSSIDDITQSTCSNQPQLISNLNTTCLTWSGLNGTTNCIIGLANEPELCGFDTTSRACAFCQSSNDSCCQSVSGCHRLSSGAIIGIIVGCLAFAGCLGAFFWFYFRHYKNGHRQLKHESILRNTNLHHDDSASALYDSVALLPTTPPHIEEGMEEFYQVKHPYPPQMGDELGLHVGDIVCVAMNFDDGWALGFNVTTGLKGVFPIVCVAPAPEELLEQLLQSEPANKILVEDEAQLQHIKESLRRSISVQSKHTLPVSELTYHNSIPRRTASMMRHDYHDHSPTSPTLHTQFFDTSNAEIIEMHAKQYKRVSKLQEQ